MSLARSASGPGGLSINTGSANLFGSNTTQGTTGGGGLFGGATAAQPTQTGGSLFGGATTQQPQQGGGLFGTTNTTNSQTSQPQQAGGLFGQPAAGTQPAQQTGGGGLFGNTTAASTQPQQQTGGLLGSNLMQNQQQLPSLFGASTTNTTQQQQPAQTGGLFGSTTTQPQPATQAGGLFGQQQPPQQQQQSNTGGMATGTGGGLLGGSLFGGLGQSTQQPQNTQNTSNSLLQSTQQQNVVPGVRIDVSNIRSTTRFNDLQEDLQKKIAMLDESIQKCIRDKEALDAFMPAHGEQIAAIGPDVSFVTRKSEGAQGALAEDVMAVNQLREMVKTDADNARLSFKAIDNLKLPTQYHQAGLWSRGAGGQQTASGSGGTMDSDTESTNSDLISFFSKTADEMEDMMKRYERNLGEIEVHLHGVQANMMEQLQRAAAQSRKNASAQQGGVDERVVELAAVLRDFEESILQVAGVVGGVREGMTELQLKDFMAYGGGMH
ncbi:hypothetical protein QBC46DRAFT_377815 [Diplogelasinospora grovesii]|uniref:Nucleoporin NUP49/NSP49 n=1 Tax=Diplogelasinospora grovesii TaxID=303347 RepID=A0AAN6NCF4_9PEZI|nr:hypothetical protein QBC46DRAFT_377815 [Diplogelasinospora grovesii]